MTSPAANTVEITEVPGTTLWIWTRYYTGEMPAVNDQGQHDGSTQTVMHPVSSPYTFPDSASAKGNAQAVSADLPAEAFIVT